MEHIWGGLGRERQIEDKEVREVTYLSFIYISIYLVIIRESRSSQREGTKQAASSRIACQKICKVETHSKKIEIEILTLRTNSKLQHFIE